jgi:nucleoside-diphosphate-sugar epimerase
LVSFAADDKKKLFNINVEGTANIVNAALHAKVRKIVHVSSVAALGRLRDGAVINETMKWSPETSNSIYGQSKYLGEMEMWRGIAEGLNVVIVNPVIIFGSANWDESSTKIFKSVYEEFPWYTDGVTGFVDVRDVVDAMIILMNSDISGEQFILSAENASYYDVFKMIAKNFGKKPPYKKITPFMSKIVWRFLAFKSMLTGKKPLVTKETTQTALTKANFDNSKLLKFLPTFKYRSLQQTIDDTCAALQQKINKQ